MPDNSNQEISPPKPGEKIGAVRRIAEPHWKKNTEILKESGISGSSLRKARVKLVRKDVEQQGISDIDHVTQLPVRRLFEERLRQEAERAKRYGHTLTWIILDLNHLKLINATQGWPGGDRALRTVADILKGSSRQIDFVARYGGDEIAVLLPETDLIETDVWWNRVQEKLQKTPYTVCAGAAEIDLEKLDPNQLEDKIETTRKNISEASNQAKELSGHTTNKMIKHFPNNG